MENSFKERINPIEKEEPKTLEEKIARAETELEQLLERKDQILAMRERIVSLLEGGPEIIDDLESKDLSVRENARRRLEDRFAKIEESVLSCARENTPERITQNPLLKVVSKYMDKLGKLTDEINRKDKEIKGLKQELKDKEFDSLGDEIDGI